MKKENKGVLLEVRKSDVITFETEKEGFKYTLQFNESINKVVLFEKRLIK